MTAQSNPYKKYTGIDSFERINYLYQISKFVSDKNPILSVYYGNILVNIGMKNVLRMHPDIKRQICKKCRCVMVNNRTKQTKIKSKKKTKYIEYKCEICKKKKRFKVSKTHKLWLEQPEAVKDVVTI